ncbi:reverse transcriptase domain-containing protein [Tanacetum coccineum]
MQVQTQVESDVAMDRRRHGNRADAQLVLILEDKPDTVPYRQDQTLTLTPEFGPGVTPGARLTRVPQCAGIIPRTCRNSLQSSEQEFTSTNWHLPLQDQILNHVSSLETLIKQHNEKCGTLITPIRLTFGEEVDTNTGKDKEKWAAGVDDDLKRSYKEVLESPFTRWIIEFSAPSHRMPTNLRVYDGSTDLDDHISRFVGAANQGEWEMPVWCRMFQQTLDGSARGWFDRMPNGSINSWSDLCERFVERFALRRRCSKDPTEVSKIVRKANESLPDFKERWTEEMGYIQGVPEVMQISAFMSNSKCPELARRFSDQVPQTVTEMMKRVDDFIKSEEAFKSTELPKGEQPEKGSGAHTRGSDLYMGQRYENRRFEHQRQEVNQLSLESLVKRPNEILATELQLQLPPPSSLVGTPKKENMDRYCDYHGEKGHYNNDCFQLKRQLEIALESGKLNHLVKDVRQRGGNRGRQRGNDSTHGRIINMHRPMGKIELEVLLRNEGLSRRTMMKFTVIEVRQAFPGESPEEKPREKKKGRPDRRRYDQPNIPGSKNHHWDTILPGVPKPVS